MRKVRAAVARYAWIGREPILEGEETVAPQRFCDELLDAHAGEELGLERLVDSIWIAIDAARPATYEQLRRGGSHARLLGNLRYISGLRRAARFHFFRLDAVVQAANLDELPEIVALARQLEADLVSLQHLRNWGKFSLAEFAAVDVALPAYLRQPDLVAIPGRPWFRGPDVELGNLRSLATARAPAAAEVLPIP
jgi:hypothetical protein